MVWLNLHVPHPAIEHVAGDRGRIEGDADVQVIDCGGDVGISLVQADQKEVMQPDEPHFRIGMRQDFRGRSDRSIGIFKRNAPERQKHLFGGVLFECLFLSVAVVQKPR